jgi:hypothetical protein
MAILSALILASRCANYQDVFVARNVYFTDADCRARMMRTQNSSVVLGLAVSRHTLCSILDRTPVQVLRFLIFSTQNRVGELYRVGK